MRRPFAPALLLILGCVEITIPADTQGGGGPQLPRDPSVAPWDPGLLGDTGGGPIDPDFTATDARDGDVPIVLPAECGTHCDCPSGWDCINTRCQLGELPILCCGHADCPAGETCWSAVGIKGVCGGL